MKWKICGMRNKENIETVSALNPDFVGFIFYPKSPRFICPANFVQDIVGLPSTIKKVGVFVDEKVEYVLDTAILLQLDYVQLHGHESADLVRTLYNRNVSVIKVFHIDERFDWDTTKPYNGLCSYFLFDTAGLKLGGNGVVFDWMLLENYQSETPFLLSGGIGIEQIPSIKKLQHPNLVGVDVNSRFEIEPGMKDVTALKTFKRGLL